MPHKYPSSPPPPKKTPPTPFITRPNNVLQTNLTLSYFEFVALIVTSRPSGDLFTHSSILSMCTVESTHFRSAPQFKDLCETKGPSHCCPGWNLGGYIALLFNKTSCFGLTVRLNLLHLHAGCAFKWRFAGNSAIVYSRVKNA